MITCKQASRIKCGLIGVHTIRRVNKKNMKNKNKDIIEITDNYKYGLEMM